MGSEMCIRDRSRRGGDAEEDGGSTLFGPPQPCVYVELADREEGFFQVSE